MLLVRLLVLGDITSTVNLPISPCLEPGLASVGAPPASPEPSTLSSLSTQGSDSQNVSYLPALASLFSLPLAKAVTTLDKLDRMALYEQPFHRRAMSKCSDNIR